MSKIQFSQQKKKLFLSGLFFFAVWLFLSNNSIFRIQYQEVLSEFPKIEINLSNDLFLGFAIVFPFLFLIGLNLLIFFYYSNQISRKAFRRTLKLTMLLMLVTLFYITIGIATQVDDEPIPTNSTSTTTTITSIETNTTTPITTSSTSPPQNISTTSGPSTISTTAITPPPGLESIVEFLSQNMIYIAVIIFVLLVIISNVRPSVPYEQDSLKKIIASEENVRKFRDIPRKHIISSYLYASRILERLGANDDYSLTPLEFNEEAQKILINQKALRENFPELTYWYEVARFSNSEIPEQAIKDIDKAIERLNALAKKFLSNHSNTKKN